MYCYYSYKDYKPCQQVERSKQNINLENIMNSHFEEADKLYTEADKYFDQNKNKEAISLIKQGDILYYSALSILNYFKKNQYTSINL